MRRWPRFGAILHQNQASSLCRDSPRGQLLPYFSLISSMEALPRPRLRNASGRKYHAFFLLAHRYPASFHHWTATNLGAGTIKNRMTALRWWCEKIDKRTIVTGRNDDYGIPKRQMFNGNKAAALDMARVASIPWVTHVHGEQFRYEDIGGPEVLFWLKDYAEANLFHEEIS